MHQLLRSPLFNVSMLVICWALQIFTAKLGFLAGAELFPFTMQTMIVTLLFLTLYVLPKKIRALKRISLKIFIELIMISALAAGFGGILSNAGIQLTTAINAGFLFQFDIALTIIIAWLLLREKLDLAKILMVLLILVGTFFLITNGHLIIPHLGDIFILLACVCFATTTVLIRKLLKYSDIDPAIVSLFRPLTGIFFLLLAILLVPFYPQSLRASFAGNLLNFKQFIYVVLNSIFYVGLLVFLNRSLKYASASYTAMMAATTPILVAILGVIFLNETLTLIQFVGAIFITSASFVTHILKVDKH